LFGDDECCEMLHYFAIRLVIEKTNLTNSTKSHWLSHIKTYPCPMVAYSICHIVSKRPFSSTTYWLVPTSYFMHNKTLLKQYYLILGTLIPWMYEDYQPKEH
jgi:hypothetical protein